MKKSLSYYSEALGLQKRDVVYTGMYTVYLAQENWMKALEMLNKAIELAPVYPDYWSWKIELLDQKTNTSYEDLKLIYEEGLSKVDQKTKVNLVTRFAMVAEINDEKADAISFWEYAKTLFPANNKIYQSEIDRLSKK